MKNLHKLNRKANISNELIFSTQMNHLFICQSHFTWCFLQPSASDEVLAAASQEDSIGLKNGERFRC